MVTTTSAKEEECSNSTQSSESDLYQNEAPTKTSLSEKRGSTESDEFYDAAPEDSFFVVDRDPVHAVEEESEEVAEVERKEVDEDAHALLADEKAIDQYATALVTDVLEEAERTAVVTRLEVDLNMKTTQEEEEMIVEGHVMDQTKKAQTQLTNGSAWKKCEEMLTQVRSFVSFFFFSCSLKF